MNSRITMLGKRTVKGLQSPNVSIRRCRLPPYAEVEDTVKRKKIENGKVGRILNDLWNDSSAIFPKTTNNLTSIYVYAKKEMAPPKTTNDAKMVVDDVEWFINDIVKRQGWRDVPVREAWLYLLIGLEIVFWFFAGETIGKFHFVGYDV